MVGEKRGKNKKKKRVRVRVWRGKKEGNAVRVWRRKKEGKKERNAIAIFSQYFHTINFKYLVIIS